MSNGRIDYLPLKSEAQDSPSYHRSPDRRLSEDDDGQDYHASESQELVSPSEREFIDHHQRLQRQDASSDSQDNQALDEAAQKAIRVQAFFCAAMLGISSHYTMHMTGPLKDVLKENMGISNTQFSLLQSSLTLFPTIIPLLGGILVERYGTGPSSIVFTSIVILGQVIVILGCWTYSVKIMIVGYCLFGLGAAPITIIQETIWVRYFKKRGLALVLALGMTSGKLAGFLALATSVPLTTLQPFAFVTPFVVSLFISVVAWGMNILFLMLLKKPKEGADTMTKITILLKAKRTHLGWQEVYGFSSMFWTLLTISFLVGASWNPFMHQASNIVKHHYGIDDEQAAWIASIILAVPLIIYPFLGTFIDHAGQRAWLLLVTAGLLICTHLLLLIPYATMPIPPTIPMLLFALSLSLGTLSIVTSMPVLTKHVPTGLGLHRSIDNIGATLFGTVAGMLQDANPTESETESIFDRLFHHFFPKEVDLAQQEREDVHLLGMFLIVAIVTFVACSIFVWGDYNWTDGEGGKTGLVNGIYGKTGTVRKRKSRSRWNRRRRSHEVLEAMTLEPIFELADASDADEVSMTEITSGSATEALNGQVSTSPDQGPTSEPPTVNSRSFDALHITPASDEDGSSEDESQEEGENERFRVRIDSGEDEVPRFKKAQAHFWIMTWSVLLVTSWAVFGVGNRSQLLCRVALKECSSHVPHRLGRLRSYATEAAVAVEEPVARATAATGQREVGDTVITTLSQATSKFPRTRKKMAKEALIQQDGAKAPETGTGKAKAKKTQGAVKPKDASPKKAKRSDESAAKAASGTRKSTRSSKSKEVVAATVLAPSPVTQLRPYQRECIDACLANLEKGIKRQIVSLPVGSGKTVIFSHLMEKVPPPFPGATKTLILAHRQELLAQTQAHVLRNGTGMTVSVDQGVRKADMSADVIVASVPSLGRAGTTRLEKYNPKEFKAIIIDEAHHAAAESYGRILKHFGAHVPETHIFVYGCSATVRRHDGLKLGGVFDYISFHKDFITMIEDKWLCNLRVSAIQTEFDLRDVKTQRGDFVQKDLSIKCNTPVRNDIVVRSYMTYCKDRKSTVVFAVDIAHAEELTNVFRRHGFDARVLSSRTSDVERAQLLADFRARKFPVIVNCGILTEGTDIPAIDSIVMARPTKSNVLFQQMLGRGMRLYAGKEDCHVLDFVDAVQGEALVSAPTLLGLDPEAVFNTDKVIASQEDIDAIRNQEIATLEKELEATAGESEEAEVVEAIDAKVAKIKVYEYENPYQLIGDCSGAPRRVWHASNNAWVSVGPNEYVLAVKPDTFKIEKSLEDGLFRCQKRVAMHDKKFLAKGPGDSERSSKKRFMSKGTMLPIEASTLEDCLRGVDTWISKHIGHKPQLIGRQAKWRKMPATESQLKFLKQLGYEHEPLDDIGGGAGIGDKTISLTEEMSIRQQQRREKRQLTKGQAANMITRLVNGAGKRWEESKKFKIKRAKAIAKEIGVEVGPIPKFVDV
ncbi:hypothetical protein EC968_003647 [Mortierella alpina]|nr:hypothetical protein EC968_003647 [Mortierella alpina]